MPLPQPLITVSSDYLGGTPVFTGTRVPVKTLFDFLEAGDALTTFLEHFPTVNRDHAVAVIRRARQTMVPELEAAE